MNFGMRGSFALLCLFYGTSLNTGFEGQRWSGRFTIILLYLRNGKHRSVEMTEGARRVARHKRLYYASVLSWLTMLHWKITGPARIYDNIFWILTNGWASSLCGCRRSTNRHRKAFRIQVALFSHAGLHSFYLLCISIRAPSAFLIQWPKFLHSIFLRYLVFPHSFMLLWGLTMPTEF